MSAQYETFDSWEEVLAFVKSGGRLLYQPPLDCWPSGVRVVNVFKNGKLRLTTNHAATTTFTADRDHLSRMRRHASKEG